MSIPSWARKGAKVVCVDNWGPAIGASLNIDVGAEYTIAAVYVSDATGLDGRADAHHSIRLFEKVNPVARLGGYDLRRFRPLITQEDDIAAHFQHHLDHTAPADLEPAA